LSLPEYQRALAAMVADPARRRAVAADPEAELARLRLTRRERARLKSFSRDRGMPVNTMLYRANRLAPICNVLPLLCDALGPRFEELVHAYWASRESEDLQFPNESARFAAYLKGPRAADLDATPGLRALLDYELAQYELAILPRRRLRATVRPPEHDGVLHPLVRVVRFDVDAEAFFATLERGDGERAALARSPSGVVIDRREEPGRRTYVAEGEAESLLTFASPRPRGSPGWDALEGAGLLVAATIRRSADRRRS
jgi:hypothetical protein